MSGVVCVEGVRKTTRTRQSAIHAKSVVALSNDGSNLELSKLFSRECLLDEIKTNSDQSLRDSQACLPALGDGHGVSHEN